MVVRLRFARPPGHTRLTTLFNIVAIDAKKARDSKPLEVLGVYDRIPRAQPTRDGTIPSNAPLTKKVEWSAERIRYWLGVGAQPSKSVVRLLERVSLALTGIGHKLKT